MKHTSATGSLAGSMPLLACACGEAAACIPPHTLRQQKPRTMTMIKDLPGEILGWSFSLPCQFVQLGFDALHKKAMEWSSPGAPDPQRGSRSHRKNLQGTLIPWVALGADQDQQILIDVRLTCRFSKHLRASFYIFITHNELEISISTLFLFN